MIVFKNYFKIVKKHLGFIIMFAAISIGISIANTMSDNDSEKYMSTNPTLAVINYDNSKLSNDFVKYISNNSKIKDIKDNKKDIQDALYEMEVDAILIIPNDFSKKFLNNEDVDIEIKKSIEVSSSYVELLVNRYFKIANIYSKSGMNEDEIIKYINEDLNNEVKVNIDSESKCNLYKLGIYYSFENYAFLSIFILTIGTIMCVFNKEEIRKRNYVSTLPKKEFTKQIFLGHLCLSISIWAIFILVSVIIYKDLMFNLNALLLILNSLVFTITATSMAYLIGNMIKNQNIISGIQNVVSLGLSFISGCFVGVELLDTSIVNFSKFFPSFWFIDNNYKIVSLTSFDLISLKPILLNMIVVLGFGILYYLISRIIIKKKLV